MDEASSTDILEAEIVGITFGLATHRQIQEHQFEDGRDHVGSNSTSLVRCDAGTGEASVADYASPVALQTADGLGDYAHHSVRGAKTSGCGWLTEEEETPLGEASVADYASPVALQSADALGDYAHHSVGGAKTSGCGWLTEEEETPLGEASVADYASPVALQSADALGDYAHHSVGGAKTSGCGWLTEEETDPDEDSVGNDDEMIQLTPEPLCEELEELLREISGEKKKKKRPTRLKDH